MFNTLRGKWETIGMHAGNYQNLNYGLILTLYMDYDFFQPIETLFLDLWGKQKDNGEYNMVYKYLKRYQIHRESRKLKIKLEKQVEN